MLIALIPAYNPTESLPNYIDVLKSQNIFSHIVIVNDGSLSRYDIIFDQLHADSQVTMVKHAINRGKGAALKTGLNYILCHFSDIAGVVTVDADGQHSIKDACNIAKTLLQNQQSLIIGSRNFKKDTPIKSLVGNFFTRHFFRLMSGLSLVDTQSGLRGIPVCMISALLKIESNGYEFELDMLMHAVHNRFRVLEVPIETIYIEGNKHSSFSPIWDSLRIYFVLFRFSLIAIVSALIDYGIFILVYYLFHPSVLLALVCGRIISVTFNYFNVRRHAFHVRTGHLKTVPKYLALACFSAIMAWLLITGFISRLGWHVIPAKITAEAIMFVINFLIQRDFIFKK